MAPRFPLAGSFERARAAAGAIAIAIVAGAVDADIIRVDDDDPAADFATIQEAVDAAVDGDRIEVWPGFYSAGAGSKTLDPVVRIDGKSITIVAIDLDPAVTVIAGQGVRRCIEWTDSPGVCKLIGFTLDGGSTSGSGGGMLIDGAAVEIEECVFQNCFAGNDGGAIHSRSETMIPPVVRDSRFEGNQAGLDGGAIAAIGGFDCLGCSFTGEASVVRGGAVSFFGNPAGVSNYSIIEDCDFVDCTARYGGGVHGDQATLLVFSSRFDGCIAGEEFPENIGWGGGLAIVAGELLMNGGRFSGCEGGESSGGLDVDSSSAMVSGVSFSANVAYGFAGGVYVIGPTATLELDDCSFNGNVAPVGAGGAIVGDNTVPAIALHRCTFDDQLVAAGATCIDAPNVVTAIDCDFNAQQLLPGGSPASSVRLNGIGTGSRFETCRFVDAEVIDLASCVRATGIGGLEFIDCDFFGNDTIQVNEQDQAEGVVYIEADPGSDAPIVFSGCRFEQNRICCWLELNNAGSGGAIRIEGRQARIVNCIFSDNRAAIGGALYGAFDISNCLLDGGASVGWGGAACFTGASTVVDTRISGSADCNFPAFRSFAPVLADGCTITGSFGAPFACLDAPIEPEDLALCGLAGVDNGFRDTRFCGHSAAAINGTWTDLGGNSFNPTACNLSDINGDGVVNGADLAQILALWGTPCLGCAVDINEDGQVDGADLALVLAGWG
jgi:predicted outer membrane repeat protein